jgi:DNA-directed RNA polymerase specialized sigma24 family protein
MAMRLYYSAAVNTTELDAIYSTSINRLQAISRGRYRFAAEDAEELVQDAWLLFLEKQSTIQTPSAWLSGTVANLCRQEIDRRTRERDRCEPLPERTATPIDDEVLAVRQGLSRLDARSRQLCELIGLEQRPYDEVSATTGLPLGSVGPLYIRAKKKLRKALEN